MAGITSRASGQSIRLLLQNNRNKVGYLGMIVESTGGFVVAPEGPEKFSVRPGVPPEYLWSTEYGIQRLVCACVYTNAQVQFRKKELGKKVGNMTRNVSKGCRSSPSINTSHFRGHVSATQGINQAVRNVTWKKP